MTDADALTAADARVAGAPSELPAPAEDHPQRGRVVEVDALRGLAAASVVLWHSLLIFPNIQRPTRGDGFTLLNVAKYSPLHIFFAGTEAVLVFFVISGFVLALPFVGDRRPSYGSFLIRRVARICLPLMAFVGLAVAVYAIVGGGQVARLSEWFNGQWVAPITSGAVLHHVLLVGNFNADAYDPVLWSLVHEMRISLVFPLLVWAVCAVPAPASLAAGALASYLALKYATSATVLSDLIVTLSYVVCFVAGILVARHRHRIVEAVAARATRTQAALAVGALLAFSFVWWWPGKHYGIVDLLGTTLGATGFLVIALASERARGVLRSRPLQFLGRISYSLYLVHAIVLLAAVHLLHGSLPLGVILPIVWVVAVGLATVGEIAVERPSIALGRYLTARNPSQPA